MDVYLMRKTEYDEITIHNFAIHLVYHWTLLVKYTGSKLYTLSTKSDEYFLMEEIARMSAVKFYDDD